MKKRYNKLKLPVALLITSVLMLSSCEKLLEVDIPVNQMSTEMIFKDSVTAVAAVNGMYTVMYNTTSGTVTSSPFGTLMTTAPGRSADELDMPDAIDEEFITNNLLPTSTTVNNLWVSSYLSIYHANKLMEGVEASDLSGSLKKQLIAEAKFIRAYCYFTLVNLFGDVPLVTTTNVEVNSSMPRTEAKLVYKQMIADLKEAQADLATDYVWSAGLRTRPNTWAATALLARVYLYDKSYDLAEAEATKVIDQKTLFNMAKVSEVFLKNSKETIWAFNTNQSGYPYIARALLADLRTGEPTLTLTPSLVSTFERDAVRPAYNDNRYDVWIKKSGTGRIYATKYTSNAAGVNTEFAVVLRLAEMYLIRAEARIQQNLLEKGTEDLDVVRSRAGLHGTFSTSKGDLLLAIERERKVELFLEFGHRWFDLKRTGRADAVLKPLKGASWTEDDQLYPIPQAQITNNSNLKPNKGY